LVDLFELYDDARTCKRQTSVKISNCITFLTTYLSIHKINKYIYIYIYIFVLAPSQSRPYDNVTTITIPHLWHPCTVTTSSLYSFDEKPISGLCTMFNVRMYLQTFLSNIPFSSHVEYNSKFSITQELRSGKPRSAES